MKTALIICITVLVLSITSLALHEILDIQSISTWIVSAITGLLSFSFVFILSIGVAVK